ncbi:MAG: P-loop NTPase [Sporolactobacillus sp.]
MIHDQASELRKRMQTLQRQLQAQTPNCLITGIISGKGGVGKSVFSTNLALALTQLNKKVLLIDLDIGMGNIEQLIGQTSLYHMDDCIRDQLPIKEAMYQGPGNLIYIPGGSGLEAILEVGEQNLRYFLEQLESIKSAFDFVFFDFGAGVSIQMLHFMRAVNQLILVTTPEPPAIADGYSALKLVCSESDTDSPLCVVNQVSSQSEALEAWKRLSGTARRFMNVDLKFLAAIHHDTAVVAAVKQQIPCVLRYPHSRFSADIRRLAAHLVVARQAEPVQTSHSQFAERVLRYFRLSRR